MSTIADLVVRLGLKDDATAGIEKFGGSLSGFARKAADAGKQLKEKAGGGLDEALLGMKEKVAGLGEALAAANAPSAGLTQNMALLGATQGGIQSLVGTVTTLKTVLAGATGAEVLGVGLGLGAVVAVAYGLKYALGDVIEQMNKAAEAEERVKETNKKLKEELRFAGLDEAQVARRQFIDDLDDMALHGKKAADALAQYDARVATIDSLKSRAKAQKQLNDLMKEARKRAEQAGMSDAQKAADNARRLHGTPEDQRSVFDSVSIEERKTRLKEKQKQLAEAIAALEKEARQAGMTEIEKKVDNVRELAKAAGAQLPKLQEMELSVKQAENQKKQAEEHGHAKKRGQHLMLEHDPVQRYKQRIAEIQHLLSHRAISTGFAQREQARADKEFHHELHGPKEHWRPGSPNALFRGSAEATMATSGANNQPMQVLTQLQRSQLEVQQKMKITADQMLTQLQRHDPAPEQVADF